MNCKFLVIAALLASCASHDVKTNTKDAAVDHACRQCGLKQQEMSWFSELLSTMQTNGTARGDLYVVAVKGEVLIVHQPHIMSCLGCLLYDCEGNRIDIANVDLREVAEAMTPANKVFSLPLQ